MGGDWQKFKLSDLAYNASETLNFTEVEEVIFINTGDVLEGKFLHNTYSAKQGLPGQAKKKIKKQDILLSEIRPENKRFAFVDFDPANYVVSTKFMIIRTKNNILPRYLYLLLTNKLVLSELQRVAESRSGTFPQITFDAISHLEFALPSIHEQEDILDVMNSLNSKIEINQRMNDTLEGIAQTLFKSWFVDFDPVKAKAEGRKPEGMDEATTALFPSNLTESSLGLIPDGWEISEIGKEVEVVGGSTPSTQEEVYWENGDFFWATPKDLSKLESPILLDTERKITELGVKQISSGQLPIDTVLLSSRAPVGYIALAKVPVSINQGFIAMKCTKKLSPYYVLSWTHFALNEIKARASGTTFAEISKSVFRPIKVIVPNVSTIKRFDDIIKLIYDRIAKNDRNTLSLMDTRDLLLPRLISGKLRVSEERTPL
jgi:type I restriction enzyme S subunit